MNRLRRRWLWWRHTWTFNQAHKPLCSRFKNDVLKIGALHVCRSCAMLYLGLTGTAVALALAGVSVTQSTALFHALLALTATLSCPPLYSRFHRTIRDLLRLSAGALVALSLAFLVLGAWFHGCLGVTLLLVLHRVFLRGRPARKLRDCDGCPELERPAVCSGFVLQAQALRKYEEQVARELMAGGYVPECVKRR